MTTLTLKLSKALDQQLTAAAKRRRASKTAILQQALREHLARQPAEPTNGSSGQPEPELTREYFEQYLQEHGVPAPESFAAQAAKYIGCIDVDGPTDLSTNPIHMEGFGEPTREYLARYLQEHGKPAPESFAAQAAEYIGSVKGAPPDLSSNKKYLEGYGES